jgi:hypothetical protein
VDLRKVSVKCKFHCAREREKNRVECQCKPFSGDQITIYDAEISKRGKIWSLKCRLDLRFDG